MNKQSLGAFVIGLALGSGFALFVFKNAINLDTKDQILFGMVPVIVLAIIGLFLHIYYNYVVKQ